MRARFWFSILCLSPILLVSCGGEGSPGSFDSRVSPREQGNWLPIWNAAITDAARLPPLLPGQVIRQFIAPLANGHTVRLKLSNQFNPSEVQLAKVCLGLQDTGATLKPSSVRCLTFDGEEFVAIAPDSIVYSDPVDFSVSTLEKVSVSISPQAPILQVSHHFTAREVPYLAPTGASAEQESNSGFLPLALDTLNSWSLIAGLETVNSDQRRLLVAVGDSITDGFIAQIPVVGSPEGVGQDVRYPDFLARRFEEEGIRGWSIANAGISGNQVGTDGTPALFGLSLLNRLERDVLSLPSLHSVIVLEGINDLGLALVPDSNRLISELESVVKQIKSRGVRVFIGTLTPARGTRAGPLAMPGGPIELGVQHGSEAVETARQAVNQWIRTQQFSDGVIDFDACLRDPAFPSYLDPRYDGGDHLHPGSEGYKAMASCVDLSWFR